MPSRAIITAALQSAGLYAAGFLIPFVGQIAVLFVPVPIILLFVREGRRAGYAALIVASGLAAALGWWQAAVILFFLSFGLMAIGLAEGIMRGLKAEQAVSIGGTLPVAALILALSVLLMKSGKNPVVVAEEYLRSAISDAQAVYARMGLTDLVQTLNMVTDPIIRTVVRLLPGILLSTSLLQAAGCYGMARAIILRRDPGSPLASQPSLATWHAPDTLVWGLIVTLGLIGLPYPSTRMIGSNLAFVYALVYLVQGISILEYLFRKARIPVIWRIFLHTIIIAMPVVIVIIPLGIVDIWADFRKVRDQPSCTEDLQDSGRAFHLSPRSSVVALPVAASAFFGSPYPLFWYNARKMRLTKELIQHIAAAVATNLESKGLVKYDAATAVIAAKIAEIITQNMLEEDKITRDAEKLLSAHEAEIARGQMDYRKVLELTKQKLAKERGFVL